DGIRDFHVTGVQTCALPIFRLAFWIGVCLLVLALFDYLYQRWEYEQSLRMSRRELKEELRQTEGDPQIRARIRQRQRQLASSRRSEERRVGKERRSGGARQQ